MGKRWDKNRHRKIYPVMRRSPQFLPEIEAITVTFPANVTLVVSATTKYQYVKPTITIGGEDNYNVWISGKTNVGDNRYTFTIERSAAMAASSQEVHLHISEAG